MESVAELLPPLDEMLKGLPTTVNGGPSTPINEVSLAESGRASHHDRHRIGSIVKSHDGGYGKAEDEQKP